VLRRFTVDRHRQGIWTLLFHVNVHGAAPAAERPNLLPFWRKFVDDIHREAPQRAHGEVETIWRDDGQFVP